MGACLSGNTRKRKKGLDDDEIVDLYWDNQIVPSEAVYEEVADDDGKYNEILDQLGKAKARKEEIRGVGEIGQISAAIGGGPSTAVRRPGELDVQLL